MREGEEVCSDPIQLRVCGPSVPDLAIVDLPGETASGHDLKIIRGLLYHFPPKCFMKQAAPASNYDANREKTVTATNLLWSYVDSSTAL